MKKKYKLIVICSAIFIFFVFLFLCGHFMLFRMYYKDPNIPINTEWYSTINNIYLKSSYDEELQDVTLSGTWVYDDDIIDLKIGIKYGQLFFSCEQFSLIMSADYKLNNNGDIVLENISYDEKINWQSTPEKIVFISSSWQKQGDKSKTGDD